MGYYLNPSDEGFRESRNGKIYVDKSELIAYTNSIISTPQKFACVSRPRRFGKTMAAKMLVAYYGHRLEADDLFIDLKIAKESSYAVHKNKYNVLMLNIIDFLDADTPVKEAIKKLKKKIVREIVDEYPQINFFDTDDFVETLNDAYCGSGRKFVVIIDEWDCLFRVDAKDTEAERQYLDFLRAWMKDKEYIALAYMTGILPVKKYGQHSNLNMFSEYSMIDPQALAEYFGFTESEVIDICERFEMPFEEVKAWYDGYYLHTPWSEEAVSIYSPRSVVESVRSKRLFNYWNQTETYEALKIYIQMDYDGLKESIVTMLAGGNIEINPFKFANDMTTFSKKDDVLALLVHLGYLCYDPVGSTVSIPNKEVRAVYVDSIEDIGWNEVIKQIKNANKLLKSLWEMDADTVARSIDEAHNEVSILQYNDENALSYVINLAFFTAKEYYTVIRELPSGKGFADICFVPRKKFADKPAMLIELKWNKSVKGALHQIKSKEYAGVLDDYKENLLLIGINYDREKKKHTCKIERY